METKLSANRAQLPGFILQPGKEVNVEGRGTGKSAGIGFTIDRCVRRMPKSVISLTGQTYGQLLTRTLPSSFKILKEMGYEKGVNFVIGVRPPSWYHDSYEELSKFDNIISFSNGTKIAMISQSEKGSGRGANIDYEIMDESLTINKEQYDQEVSPTVRGNMEFFGEKSKKPINIHHGFKYSTSMPPTKTGRWVLEYAKYYQEEAGIPLFVIWNKIVKQQIELLDIEDPKQFKDAWNEIARLKAQIRPFVSKDGILFTLSNAFDNLDFVGLSYIKENKKKLPLLIFLVEIMNFLFDKVEDCFYAINDERQIYYSGLDEELLKNLAKDTDFDLEQLSSQNSIQDRDCNTAIPLEIVPDWGSAISLFCVCQTRNFDYKTGLTSQRPVFNFINEFYSKPEGNSNILIKELCDQFCNYYKSHQNRRLLYYRDRYGDHKNPAVVNSKSFNEQAIEYLTKRGWNIEEIVHKGMEPPMSDKYLLWGMILREEDPTLPIIRINGNKCKFTLISMNNAMVKEVDGKLQKDKTSERKGSGVLPEEATHFSDAADKIVWTKFSDRISSGGRVIIPVRFGAH